MATIPNTHDGGYAAPKLAPYLHLGTIQDLPDNSKAPRGDCATIAAGLRSSGYEGIQSETELSYRDEGLSVATLGRANTPEEIRSLATGWKNAGWECGTLHVGWGWESDAEIDTLVDAIITIADELGFPLFLETHRATITENPWRTCLLVERNPDIRLNGDFSHWYTGNEFIYGDIDEKLDRLGPVFERIRFIHARVGNSCCMQVPLDDPGMRTPLNHFVEMWRRSFRGFLSEASRGDKLIFAPELLPSSINYARRVHVGDGTWEEDSDRWLDARRLVEIAGEVFDQEMRRTVPRST
jgi:hypothetical protein